jgi:hypothetical protein
MEALRSSEAPASYNFPQDLSFIPQMLFISTKCFP